MHRKPHPAQGHLYLLLMTHGRRLADGARGGRMDVGFVPKILLKIAVKDEDLEKAVEAIAASARTGQVGDGKLFTYQLSRVLRIRTGEKDNDAL